MVFDGISKNRLAGNTHVLVTHDPWGAGPNQ